jgi:hypothetical protein
MIKSVIPFFLLLFFQNSVTGQNNLKTVAEASNFESTSRHTEVLQFIKQLEKSSPYIRTETIATTIEGREIPLMIIANPMPKSPKDLKNDSRIVIYIQGNIHAGEVEGKEASLMFARDVLKVKNNPLLKNVVLLICPNLNADGNDKISKDNRSYQPGPKNGVGVRHNANFLDLNRDGIKLESEEMKGVIANILNRWDPAVTMDCHTTNGVYRQEPTTFSWMVNPNGDNNLIHYMRDKMAPKIGNTLRDTYKIENCFFGEFEKLPDGTEVYMEYAHEPRYLVNYIGIRNRIAILNENYVYADYKTRVEACYFLIKSLLDYVNENKSEIKGLIKNADFKTMNRWKNATHTDSISFDYEVRPNPELITIKTYEMEKYKDERGNERMRPTDIKKTLTLPYYADFIPTKSMTYPYAYFFSVPDKKVLNNIMEHGIKIEKLTENQTFEVDRFDISSLKGETRLNQGHYTNSVEGNFVTESKLFEKGNYVVRTSQPLANVIIYLLEPKSGDGLLYWNYFDKYLTPQWGRGFYPYPVYKINQKTEIKSVLMN